MVLGKLPVPGRPATLDYSRARACALAVGAYGGCLDFFSLIYHFSSFSLSLGDDPISTEILSQTAVQPKQPTNRSNMAYIKKTKPPIIKHHIPSIFYETLQC